MVQLDASPFSWLSDGKTYHLYGVIDDATGQVLALYLARSECLEGYFQIVRLMLLDFGIPVSIYSDCHSIFFSPKTDKLSLEDQLAGKRVNLTQFGRAMDQLGIHMIAARSPQAKGRIERLWQTLQSRLTVELKYHGIKMAQGAKELPLLPPKGRIAVLVSPYFGLKASYQGNIYDTAFCVMPKAKKANKPIREKKIWVPE